MRKFSLLLIVASFILASCASRNTSHQPSIEHMVEELAVIADNGLACLEDHSVVNPTVSYDVIETDSLINPILGVIEVEVWETIATVLDGTPIAKFLNKFELTFAYQEGRWIPKDIEVIQGRHLSDTDPVNVCFR